MDCLPTPSNGAPRARTPTSDSLIQEQTQKKFTRATPPPAVSMPPPRADVSEDEDDFPTPRAHLGNTSSSANCASSSSQAPHWRSSSASAGTYFEDELYDSPSDVDSEVVPFRISNSIKQSIKTAKQKHGRTPSLVIPSPGMWPTVQKSLSGGGLPLQSPRTPLSPAALARLVANTNLRVPSQSTTPSLDGSLTSEEVSTMSNPSTPDLRFQGEGEGEWDAPVQLHPEAMETLLQISREYHDDEVVNPALLEVPMVPPSVPQQMAERGLNISITIPKSSGPVAEDEFSALSIPSPGGFFASLGDGSSHVWSLSRPRSEPSTSIAETFYDVPWRREQPKVLERVVEVDECSTEGPPTARRLVPDVQGAASQRTPTYAPGQDYDDEYARKLQETADTSKSRTSIWLQTQKTYFSPQDVDQSLITEDIMPQAPRTPVSAASPVIPEDASTVSPSKKSVRFAEDTTGSPPSIRPGTGDSVFYRAFQHFNNKRKARDAFTNREARADALRAQRLYLAEAHRTRLMGSFAIAAPKAPKKDSAAIRHVPNDEESAREREVVAAAGKEQQAMDQVSTTCFDLEADRFLSGGCLLPRAAADHVTSTLRTGQNVRILDLGGQPTASWGWSMATEYREAKVYTAISESWASHAGDWTAHRGPSNHRTVVVPNLWSLPFPSGTFNVISARTLHTFLRNYSTGSNGDDEYDAVLKELHRVLAPGGYLHFTLLDAEVAAPSNSSIAAKGVEFAVSLRARGYDPCAGRRFVPRLEKAGFGDVRRTWMSLPWGGATSEGIDAVTGLFGSLAWERWMLKFQKEVGRPEERLLDGVAKALDEAVAHEERAAWRMLVGCSRKMK